jgi:hypothetical protein
MTAPDEQLTPGSTPAVHELHDESAERVSLARPLVGGAARGTGQHEGEGDDRKARRWSDWLDLVTGVLL